MPLFFLVIWVIGLGCTSRDSILRNPVIVGGLEWNGLTREIEGGIRELSASFDFHVSNVGTNPVVITIIKPACGCTVVDHPPLPWTLAPGESGPLKGVVDLKGKTGTLEKTIDVTTENGVVTQLRLTVVLPFTEEERRRVNMAAAKGDRNAIFKHECAACHVEPAKGQEGPALFTAACGICHESAHRASMVPNLAALSKPLNRDDWRNVITQGKPGTLMPGFAESSGGPLTAEQIESLIEYAYERFRPKFDFDVSRSNAIQLLLAEPHTP